MTVVDNSIKEEKWYPLMSDTSVMNALVEKMGFNTSLYEFTDIFSIELWEIKKITQPVAAVMMLIPLTQVHNQYNEHEQHTPTADNIWFIRDHVNYTCGTIALLHAILNALNGVKTVAIHHDSWLHSFYDYCTVAMDHNDKADVFEGDKTIKMLHNEAARNLEDCSVAQPTAIKDEQLPVEVTSGSESTASKKEQLQGNIKSESQTDEITAIKDEQLPVEVTSGSESTASKNEQLQANIKSESQTDEISGHFITMVHINGGLYELDGKKTDLCDMVILLKRLCWKMHVRLQRRLQNMIQMNGVSVSWHWFKKRTSRCVIMTVGVKQSWHWFHKKSRK